MPGRLRGFVQDLTVFYFRVWRIIRFCSIEKICLFIILAVGHLCGSAAFSAAGFSRA
jgi:hypothetical protein